MTEVISRSLTAISNGESACRESSPRLTSLELNSRENHRCHPDRNYIDCLDSNQAV